MSDCLRFVTVGGEPLELSIPYADHAKALETLLARLANYKPLPPSFLLNRKYDLHDALKPVRI
jgi:hypothetical protein